jgi:hypothetical protein
LRAGEISQRAHRPGDVEQDRIGTILVRQFHPAVAHGLLGHARVDARDRQVGAEGRPQGVDVHYAAPRVGLLDSRRLAVSVEYTDGGRAVEQRPVEGKVVAEVGPFAV